MGWKLNRRDTGFYPYPTAMWGRSEPLMELDHGFNVQDLYSSKIGWFLFLTCGLRRSFVG